MPSVRPTPVGPPGVFSISAPPGLEPPTCNGGSSAFFNEALREIPVGCGEVDEAMSACSTTDTNESAEDGLQASSVPSPASPVSSYVPGSILHRLANEKPPGVSQMEELLGGSTAGYVFEASVDCFEPELPSRGSALHQCGQCKPCEFFHRTVCRAGAECKFCHLCGPMENKLRKKTKHAAMRAVKQLQWQTGQAGSTLNALASAP